jgi:hypothetical protein
VTAGRRLAAATAFLVALAVSPSAAQDQPAPTPTTAAPAPTTTIPAGCTPPMPVAVEFVGKVTTGDASIARFAVTQVRQGQVGPLVDIDYSGNDDRRYIKDGHTYLVVAALDPESSHLISKARRPQQEPKACAKFDPIYTNNADGTSIDSSILGGLHGHWGDIAGAFLLPTAVVFAILFGLVILKHTFLLTGRGIGYARRRHHERRATAPPRPRPDDDRARQEASTGAGPRSP